MGKLGPESLVAEKPSYSRGPDGRYPYGVASFQKTMCAAAPRAHRLARSRAHPYLSSRLRPLGAHRPACALVASALPAAWPDIECSVCLSRSRRAELKGETFRQSTMAQTTRTGSRGAASRGYLMANASFAQIDVVKRQEREVRKREEEERQKQEQLNLSKAYKIEKARFEAEWAGRIEAVEAECAEKERVLKEVREIATSASGAGRGSHADAPHLSQ